MMILATQVLAIAALVGGFALGCVICFGLISLLLHFWPIGAHRDRAAEAADWLGIRPIRDTGAPWENDEEER